MKIFEDTIIIFCWLQSSEKKRIFQSKFITLERMKYIDSTISFLYNCIRSKYRHWQSPTMSLLYLSEIEESKRFTITVI